MDAEDKSRAAATRSEEEKDIIKKGPWTPEEDTMLVNYIASHGEGRWNSLARSAGLKRTGKSCRLRWLNYLRPDVRRGNITLPEQLLILHLHSRLGNRWSKIAQHLPGRTDNEIKNYWRTKVLKQAKQLKCDVNSKQFRDTMRYVWMPRLLERIRATSNCYPTQLITASMPHSGLHPGGRYVSGIERVGLGPNYPLSESSTELHIPSNSDHSESSELVGIEHGSDFVSLNDDVFVGGNINGAESLESLWNEENIRFLRQQLCDDLQMKEI